MRTAAAAISRPTAAALAEAGRSERRPADDSGQHEAGEGAPESHDERLCGGQA